MDNGGCARRRGDPSVRGRAAEKFGRLFVVMLLYSLCYGATLPLANVLIFRHAAKARVEAPSVFIWAPIAWALTGYFLTGLRQLGFTKSDGADALKLAAILSVAWP